MLRAEIKSARKYTFLRLKNTENLSIVTFRIVIERRGLNKLVARLINVQNCLPWLVAPKTTIKISFIFSFILAQSLKFGPKKSKKP